MVASIGYKPSVLEAGLSLLLYARKRGLIEKPGAMRCTEYGNFRARLYTQNDVEVDVVYRRDSKTNQFYWRPANV